MVTFTLRFYGRFVLARQRDGNGLTGQVKFLMPAWKRPVRSIRIARF